MFAKREPKKVKLCSDPHPDYEQVNTSVSEYFRKYAQGKVDNMPTDSRPTVTDDRPTDEMLNDDSRTNHMSCDDLDALHELEQHREEFEAAINEIELSEKQTKAFKDAVKIIDDPNSTVDQKREAYEVLEELKDKITRARKI